MRIASGSIAGAYNHPNYVERLSQAPPNLPLVLSLCPAGVPTKMPFTVGSKGEENMLGIAIKVTLDPDPKKHVKVIVHIYFYMLYIVHCVDWRVYRNSRIYYIVYSISI